MAGKERDVSLVIKAKEQSQKAIDAVADALRALEATQNKFGQSANKTGGLVERLQGAFSDLDNELKGLAALNRVAANMDKAADAVGRLDAEVKASIRSEEQLMRQMDAAAEATDRARRSAEILKGARDEQRKIVAALSAEEKKNSANGQRQVELRDQLNKAYARAEAAVNKAVRTEEELFSSLQRTEGVTQRYQQAFAESSAEMSQMAAIAQRLSSALGGVEATQEAIARASEKASAEQLRLNAAIAAAPKVDNTRLLQAGVVSDNKQTSQVVAALKAYREAEAELQRLTETMNRAGGESVELQRDLDLATVAARTAAAEYSRLRKELNDAAAARRALKASGAETITSGVSSTSAVAAVSPKVPTSIRQTATEANRLRDAFKGIYGESRQAMNLFQRMRGEVLSLTSSFVGLYAAIAGIGSVINVAISYQSAFNKLMVVTGGDAAMARLEMSYLQGEAERLGITFTTLAGNYASFADAAQGANFSLEDTRKLFKSVSEAAVVMNVSSEDTQGIFKALGQIMSKGKVQAEELRGQLGDRMTGAFRLMAEAIGVTTAQLDKMLADGEVFADRSTLLSFADTLSNRYGKQLPEALRGTNAEIGRFQNNMVEAQNRIAQSGFLDSFTNSLREVNEWFQSDEGEKFFTGLGVALGKLVSIFPALLQNLDKFILAFQIFAALKLSQVVQGMIGSFGGIRVATAAARNDVAALTLSLQIFGATSSGVAATGARTLAAGLVTMRGAAVATAGAFRALWLAVGGLPGLIITAITTLATFVLPQLLTNTDKATEALNAHRDAIDKVAEAFVKAGDDSKKLTENLAEISATELELNTRDLQQSLDDARKKAKDAALSFTAAAATLKSLFNGTYDTNEQLHRVAYQFERGEISAAKFKAQIDAIAQANPNLDRTIVRQMIDVANEGIKSETALKKNEAAARLLKNAADPAAQAVLGLGQALGSIKPDTSGIDAYTAAMERLAGKIPALKQAADLASGLSENQAIYEQGLQGIYGGFNQLPAYLKKRENAKEVRQFLNPVEQKKLDALLARTAQADAAVTTENTPKTPKGRGKSKAEEQADLNEQLRRAAELRQLEVKWLYESEREQQILRAIDEAQYDAKRKGLKLSEDQVKAIRDSVGAEYDAQQAAKDKVAIAEAELKLVEAREQMITREQFIMRELGVTRLDNLTAEQTKLAEIAGQLYDIKKAEDDRTKAVEARKKAEDAVTDPIAALQAQRDSILAQIDTYSAMGETAKVSVLKGELESVNAELLKAIDNAIAFYKALAPTDPNAAAALAGLEAQRARIEAIGKQAVFTGDEINQSLSKGVAGAFDAFAEAAAKGENAFAAAGDAFRQFASDFLRQIAQMIIQQLILNILSGGTTGGGAGGGLSSILNSLPGLKTTTVPTNHTGGIVGSERTSSRTVYATAFANAQRYHTGGIAGIKPDEVPTILQKGEGVFTAEQMKAMGGGAGTAQPSLDAKIVNLFDIKELGRQMLKDADVQKVLVNVIGDNSRGVQAALGR